MKEVFKADIECSIGMRGEDLSRLANNVFGATVLVSYRILDLHVVTGAVSFQDYCQFEPIAGSPIEHLTHIDIDNHAIALVAVDGGRDYDEGILGDKVADAPLVPPMLGFEIELEGGNGRNEE